MIWPLREQFWDRAARQPQAIPLAFAAAGTAIAGSALVAGLLGSATAAALLGAGVTVAGSLIYGRIARPASADVQVQYRAGERNPHPLFNFACGGPIWTGTSEVFRHVKGEKYYRIFKCASEPCESIDAIRIYGDQVIELADLTSSAAFYDMAQGAEIADISGSSDPLHIYDGDIMRLWGGLGDQTQFPQEFIDQLGAIYDAIPESSWKGCTILCTETRFGYPLDHPRWRRGVPEFEVLLRGGKRWDPRLDDTIDGGSGPQRRDDPSTHTFTRNPALNDLHILRHRRGLGVPDSQILVEDYMTAADDCGAEIETSLSLHPVTNAGATLAAGYANGVTISGFSAAQSLVVTLPAGQTYGSWSPWGTPSPANDGVSGTKNSIWVAVDGDAANAVVLGDQAVHDGYEAARVAFGTAYLTGGESYTFFILDSNPPDNTGGIEVSISAEPAFACDGIVKVESRRVDLLDGIKASMGAVRDTSFGTFGIRAGVWRPPSHTLTTPLAEGFEWSGRSDPGWDAVIGVFLSADKDHQQTQTRKVLVECDGRNRQPSATSYTLVAGDLDQHVQMDAAAAAVTVPAGVFAAKHKVIVEFVRGGTLVAGSGMTLDAEDGLSFAEGEYARLTFRTATEARVDHTSMGRVFELDLAMVSGELQAVRLAKLHAARLRRNRQIAGLFGPQEYERRIAETVTLSRTDIRRPNGTYMVAEEQDLQEEVEGGIRMVKSLVGVEDSAETYAFDAATEFDAPVVVTPVQSVAPGLSTGDYTVTLTQNDVVQADGTTKPRLRLTVTASAAVAGAQDYYRVWLNDGSGYEVVNTIVPNEAGYAVTIVASSPVIGTTYQAAIEPFSRTHIWNSDDLAESNQVTVTAPATGLGPPALVSESHDAAHTRTLTLRAPNGAGVAGIRLYVNDADDRGTAELLETRYLGANDAWGFTDALAYDGTTRWYWATTFDGNTAESADLDLDSYDAPPGSTPRGFSSGFSPGFE